MSQTLKMGSYRAFDDKSDLKWRILAGPKRPILTSKCFPGLMNLTFRLLRRLVRQYFHATYYKNGLTKKFLGQTRP